MTVYTKILTRPGLTQFLFRNGEHCGRIIDADKAAARSSIKSKLAPGATPDVQNRDIFPRGKNRQADIPENFRSRLIEAVIEACMPAVSVMLHRRPFH